ncbi:MAG: plasmid stability protein [Alphaproteobacteria bacterium]|nr:plasmid stability protein [Alphaproteobacteria bacterium]
MAAMIVRKISDATHRALRMRAAQKGRSVEAEVRAILDEAVRSADRPGIGTALMKMFRPGVDLEVRRNRAPAEPAEFK